MIQNLIAIAVGGALGALARYGIAFLTAASFFRWRPHSPPLFPWGTLIANVVGAFLMGVLFQLFLARPESEGPLRLLLTTGFLGALTTFSTFALEGVLLWQGGHSFLALVYMVSSHILGFTAVLIGMWLVA